MIAIQISSSPCHWQSETRGGVRVSMAFADTFEGRCGTATLAETTSLGKLRGGEGSKSRLPEVHGTSALRQIVWPPVRPPCMLEFCARLGCSVMLLSPRGYSSWSSTRESPGGAQHVVDIPHVLRRPREEQKAIGAARVRFRLRVAPSCVRCIRKF